ncbi:radical SAM protein [Spongiibacter sp.]|uniref:B12-binding domain-containing radical SAM protein n=1 Tax=Spongiibacter sp. TaxID=2024860 RepID=UPI003563B3F2
MTPALPPRPVCLFSMDSDGFWAVPTTTGGLKAYYQHYGEHPEGNDIRLLHFRDSDAADQWKQQWPALRDEFEGAIARGQQPVVGFSMYTWNAAEFLELIAMIKADCPQTLCIAGGPHVQQAEDYLFDDPIDVIALGEAETTFQQWLDCERREDWSAIDGLAYLHHGEIHKTAERKRRTDLDALPSALDVVPLCDDNGKPLYDSVSYESSRGCPFKCAFCEWGTGAIGSKMYQFSMPRIERDWRKIVAAGIKDIWLADSNFGALREDLDKAKLICELKSTTGLPSSFATSWSKKHSPRVQEIVLLLHQHGLLPHYQLALQTLTPKALELSNRKNMAANKYEPIAKDMASKGVPIAAELIWGLPGDNLPDFEKNLDELLQVFPNLNIFAYTLLPGTEFYEKREEYRIETIPVAGYGKAKGEYVVACHSFDREQGLQGYLLITAHILFAHGHIMPYSIRYIAQQSGVTTATLMRELLLAVCREYADELPSVNIDDPLSIYESRNRIFTESLRDPERLYRCLNQVVGDYIGSHSGASSSLPLKTRLSLLLELDKALSPRWGEASEQEVSFSFDALACKRALDEMSAPDEQCFSAGPQGAQVRTPGGVGSILHEPDGGAWLRGEIQQHSERQVVRIIQPGLESLAH